MEEIITHLENQKVLSLEIGLLRIALEHKSNLLKSCETALIESYARQSKAKTKRGVNYCTSHGGYGFTSDCVTCRLIKGT